MVDRHKLTVFYLKSFDMDSVQVGKAVFGKEIHTTLGIEPRTNSNPGRYGNPYSVCWVKKKSGLVVEGRPIPESVVAYVQDLTSKYLS